MPPPLPWPTATPQLYANRVNSPGLRIASVKGFSVTPSGELSTPLKMVWSVASQAANPRESCALASRAEFAQLPETGVVARSLMTTEVGVKGKSGLEIRSFWTESETRPFGVTGHEQQETVSSLLSKT